MTFPLPFSYYLASFLLTRLRRDRIVSALFRILRAFLTGREVVPLVEPPTSAEADYEQAFQRAARSARQLATELERSRKRIDRRYRNLVELPEGRRATLLQNSSPGMLLALAYRLIRQSFAERFGDAHRSHELARLAVEISELVAKTGFLSPESAADLRAEALLCLGNARRIRSDLVGAGRAFARADRFLTKGTGDRTLKAERSAMMGALLSTQGQSEYAVVHFDKEIALRKLVGDQEKLGHALLSRGWVGCWVDGATPASCDFLRRGLELVDDHRMMLLALHALAEALARGGKELDAWKVMWTSGLVLESVHDETLRLRHRWIEGIIYRGVGRLEDAERTLTAVRDGFLERGIALQASLASMDLAGVLAAQGRYRELRRLVCEAHAVFRAERLERRALAAVLMLREAAEAERVSEQLAVAVANFLARFQHNRNLRFERPEE